MNVRWMKTKAVRVADWLVALVALSWVSTVSVGHAQFFEEKLDYEKVFLENLSRNGKTLDLSGKKIGDEGLKLLSDHKILEKVTSLDLRYNLITPEGIKFFVASTKTGKLKSLEIRHNDLGDAGAILLAEAQSLPRLKKLKMGWNQVRDAGGLAIAKSDAMKKTLTHLDMRGNFLADETKNALKESYAHLKKLRLY